MATNPLLFGDGVVVVVVVVVVVAVVVGTVYRRLPDFDGKPQASTAASAMKDLDSDDEDLPVARSRKKRVFHAVPARSPAGTTNAVRDLTWHAWHLVILAMMTIIILMTLALRMEALIRRVNGMLEAPLHGGNSFHRHAPERNKSNRVWKRDSLAKLIVNNR